MCDKVIIENDGMIEFIPQKDKKCVTELLTNLLMH